MQRLIKWKLGEHLVRPVTLTLLRHRPFLHHDLKFDQFLVLLRLFLLHVAQCSVQEVESLALVIRLNVKSLLLCHPRVQIFRVIGQLVKTCAHIFENPGAKRFFRLRKVSFDFVFLLWGLLVDLVYLDQIDLTEEWHVVLLYEVLQLKHLIIRLE